MIVPGLVVLLALDPRFAASEVLLIAVATSLGVVVFTSLSAAIAQIRAGRVVWSATVNLAPFLVLGSFAAGFVAAALPLGVMRAVIALFLLFVATVMFTRWQPSAHRALPGLAPSVPIGLSGGLISGIAGIAGGNVIVPTLIYFGVPVHNATATSSAMGVPIALAGVVGYLVRGWQLSDPERGLIAWVHWPSFLTIVVAASLCAPLGVHLAAKVPALALRRVFALLLVAASVRILLLG